jgi:hypothetical protein
MTCGRPEGVYVAPVSTIARVAVFACVGAALQGCSAPVVSRSVGFPSEGTQGSSWDLVLPAPVAVWNGTLAGADLQGRRDASLGAGREGWGTESWDGDIPRVEYTRRVTISSNPDSVTVFETRDQRIRRARGLGWRGY